MGVVLRLFWAEVDVADIDGRTPLHVACFYGHLDVVEYLVTERRASLNKQDKDGLTPFELACQAGCVSVVYYLVRYHTSNMWDRSSQNSLLSYPYSRSAQFQVEEFSCSYSNISTTICSSCYSKEDPFSFSCGYSIDCGKEDYQSNSTSSTSYTLSLSYPDDDEPYTSPSSHVSSLYPPGEPFVFSSSRFRSSLYDDEPIYY